MLGTAALDAADGLSARFDVITTFDVVHDAVDPERLLHAIHDALVPTAVRAGRSVCRSCGSASIPSPASSGHAVDHAGGISERFRDVTAPAVVRT